MKQTATIEVDAELKDRLDRVAAERHEAPSRLLQQALEQFLDRDAWFRSQVEAGMREADAGDFLSPEEKAAAYKRWAS